MLAQIPPYTKYLSDQNNAAVGSGKPLLAVIGDSTAIGIGASKPENSYIGLLREALCARDNTDWHVANLAISGAKAADGLKRQLPIVEKLEAHGLASLTLCCIGSNDVLWNRKSPTLHHDLQTIISRLPEASIVGLVAGTSQNSKNANLVIRRAAEHRSIPVVNLWRQPGAPALELAEDRFHPNDAGYAAMAERALAAIRVSPPE